MTPAEHSILAERNRIADENAGLPRVDWTGVAITSDPVQMREGLSATFSIAAGRLVVGWHPRQPRSRRPIWNAYKAARDAFLDRVETETGLRMRVIDL